MKVIGAHAIDAWTTILSETRLPGILARAVSKGLEKTTILNHTIQTAGSHQSGRSKTYTLWNGQVGEIRPLIFVPTMFNRFEL
jgi:hypothetical protein